VVKSRRQQSACDYLVSLSTSKSLRSKLVDVLLDAVADVAERLRRIASDDDDTVAAASQLENVAYVLDAAERMLAAAADNHGDAVELRRRLSSQLDLSLRHVASAFPLFAYRVWQLAGVVDRQLATTSPQRKTDRLTD